MKFTVILKESLGNLVRFKELTAQSIGILAVALYLLGIYFIVEANVAGWLRNLEEKVEISCYLKPQAKEPEIMEALSRLRNLPNVTDVKFISKTEAMQKFVQDPEIGEQIKILGENPLPASIMIKLKDKRPAVVEIAVNEFRRSFGDIFEEISYAKDEVKNLSSAFVWIKYGGIILGVVFFAITMFLLVFTLKIGRAERQDELRIMRLMGAEEDFLAKPFYYEGLIIGTLGFLASSLMLYASYFLFNMKFRIAFIGAWHMSMLFGISIIIPFICDTLVMGGFGFSKRQR